MALLSGEGPCLSRDLEVLLCAVPQDRLESWLVPLLKTANTPPDPAPLRALLVCHRRPWGEALTRAWASLVGTYLAQGTDASRQWARALPDLAPVVAPALVDEIEKGWPPGNRWPAQTDSFLAALRLRARMGAAFGLD